MKRLAKMVLAVIAALAFNANANEAININCEEVANHVAAYHDMIKKNQPHPQFFLRQLIKILKVNQFMLVGLIMAL